MQNERERERERDEGKQRVSAWGSSVNRKGLEGEQQSNRDGDGKRGEPGVKDQSEKGEIADRKRESEKHHVLWEREWLSLLSPGLSAVQFETDHQRCLHTMATPS